MEIDANFCILGRLLSFPRPPEKFSPRSLILTAKLNQTEVPVHAVGGIKNN